MKKVTELKTFEQACKELSLDPAKVIPDFSMYPEKDREAMIAHAKLIIIVRAANKIDNGGKEWAPDWKNFNEYKYEPWFDMNDSSSGSGFSYDDYDYWGTVSGVGSRLCFKSRETAKYIAKQFIDLYEAYFVIK